MTEPYRATCVLCFVINFEVQNLHHFRFAFMLKSDLNLDKFWFRSTILFDSEERNGVIKIIRETTCVLNKNYDSIFIFPRLGIWFLHAATAEITKNSMTDYCRIKNKTRLVRAFFVANYGDTGEIIP